MKVIYVKTIQEKLEDAIRQARTEGKMIDYFELTRSEYMDLTGVAPCSSYYFMHNGYRIAVK